MLEVVDRQSFENLAKRVLVCEERQEFIENLIESTRFVSQKQAMLILDISRMQLWRLTKAGELTHRYEGKRPQYCLTSLRQYLLANKIEGWAAKKRILEACFAN